MAIEHGHYMVKGGEGEGARWNGMRIAWAMVHNFQGMMRPVSEVSSALKGPWFNLSHSYVAHMTSEVQW